MKNLIIALCLCISLDAFSQTKSTQTSLPLSTVAPESVGMSSERLARIDAMCKKAIEENEMPGIVALVARKGKIVFHEAYGMANNETKHSLEKDDIFRIASQTKAITSTAVMMLLEEGKFR